MALIGSVGRALRRFYLPGSVTSRYSSSKVVESDEEFDQRYVKMFMSDESDGWKVRWLMNSLQGMDMVPSPNIIEAALRACRRENDYALAVRFLEAVKYKCGGKVGEIWPYIIQEIKPTLDELGVDTPEQLGYDKPELALKNIYDD